MKKLFLCTLIITILISTESKCDEIGGDPGLYIIYINHQENTVTASVLNLRYIRNIPFYFFHLSIPCGIAVSVVIGTLIRAQYARLNSLPIGTHLGSNDLIRECSAICIFSGIVTAALQIPIGCLTTMLYRGISFGSGLFYYLMFTDEDELYL